MITERTNNFTDEAMKHQKNILTAVHSYINTSATLNTLSDLFSVSLNTLCSWFCEGISKRYIADDSMCMAVMKKHIAEYESLHYIDNSALRSMYDSAFTERLRCKVASNPDSLATA